MRILNIIFNTEIKYQQYAKLGKFRHKNFRSNFDPGKTHKGKTSERGFFIIYGLLRNSFTANSSSEILQTYLDNPVACSSISEPEIRTTVRLSQH